MGDPQRRISDTEPSRSPARQGERPTLVVVPEPACRTARRHSLPRRLAKLAWVLIRIAVFAGCVGLVVAWRVFGIAPLAVTSGSMEPGIPLHALLFVKEAPAASVRRGDIITFTPPGREARVTHRVVKRSKREGNWFFETKGDANAAVDDWRRFVEAPEQPAAAAGKASRKNGAAYEGPKREYTRGITYGSRPAVKYIGHVPYLGRIASVPLPGNARVAMVLMPLVVVGIWLLTLIWARPIEQQDGKRASRQQSLAPTAAGAPAVVAPPPDDDTGETNSNASRDAA